MYRSHAGHVNLQPGNSHSYVETVGAEGSAGGIRAGVEKRGLSDQTHRLSIIVTLTMKSVSSQAVTIADKWCARRRGHQSTYWPQLHFVANVVVYVKHLQKLTARAPNAKSDAPKPLSESVPLFGPRFIPPNALWESSKRGPAADVTPESLYLKPVTVIHPFYFRGLCHCPNDLSTEPSERHDFKWDGWTTMGPQSPTSSCSPVTNPSRPDS